MSRSSSRLVTLTQRVRFEAAHRLYSPALSEEENREVYGKCSRAKGHGHNYEVEVTLLGTVDPVTGLLWTRTGFREAIDRAIVSRCDHRNLDEVVDEVTTGENLARIFYAWMAPELPANLRLHRVRVYETPRNVFDAFDRVQEEPACKN